MSVPLTFLANMIISALVISTAAWLAGRFPALAGFLVAMPVASLLVLPLAQLQHGDPGRTIELARSILVAIPVTVMFFLPFLAAERFGLSFWEAYTLGLGLLAIGYLLHRAATGALVGGS